MARLLHGVGEVLEQDLLIGLEIVDALLQGVALLEGGETLLLAVIPHFNEFAGVILDVLLLRPHLIVVHFGGLLVFLQRLLLRLLASHHVHDYEVLLLLVACEDVSQVNALPLIVNALLALLAGYLIFDALFLETLVLHAEPVLFELEVLLFPFVGLLGGLVGLKRFLELLLCPLAIDIELSYASLHHRHLSFLFALQQFGLELAAWALMLHLVDERFDLLRR